MDVSEDEYFADDIILDDETLAILDQEEQKYTSQPPGHPPSNKRQRTDYGWKPGPGVKAGISYDDDDDVMPEISLREDGTYGISDAPQPNLPQQPPQPKRIISHNGRYKSIGTRSSTQSLDPLTSRTSAHLRPDVPPTLPGQIVTASNNTASRPPDLGYYTLQNKYQELEARLSRNEEELEQVKGVRLAKEGEVTILRQNITKVNQEHATKIAQLQAAKESEETKQIKIQRELKEEIERLKTQLLFKQNESENPMRKVPSSARAKRTRDDPVTPLRLRNMHLDLEGTRVQETPQRTQFSFPTRNPLPVFPVKSPEAKRPSKLPGFSNSFVAATPIQQSPSRWRKPSPERRITPTLSREQEMPLPSPSQMEAFGGTTPLEYEAGISYQDRISFMEESMDLMELEETVEETEFFAPVDPAREFFSILLTHRSRMAESTTLRLLMAASPEDYSLASAYTSTCDCLLKILAGHLATKNFSDTLNQIAKLILSMISLLESSCLFDSLSLLLRLVMELIFSTPTFAQSLLSSEQPNIPSIIFVFCEIIHSHLDATRSSNQIYVLIKEVICVCEVLSLNIPDDSILSFLPLVTSRTILTQLIDDNHPIWLRETFCRFLTRLSIYPQLACAFLTNTSLEQAGHARSADGSQNLPVDRLCSYFVGVNHQSLKTHNLRMEIFRLITTLCLSGKEAHASLASAPILIPSIIHFISQMVNFLWEEDEIPAKMQKEVLRNIFTLNQALILLHHLILGIDPNVPLTSRLQAAPRPLNTAPQIFLAAFGRLSYADPPDWLSQTERVELESTTEISRELLELVIDGPEGDSIWRALQIELEEDKIIDEGDMEAELLGDMENM